MNRLCRNPFEEKAARKSRHNSLFTPKNELELAIETFCKSYESFFATEKLVITEKGATTIRASRSAAEHCRGPTYWSGRGSVQPLARFPHSSIGALTPVVIASEQVLSVAFYLAQRDPNWDGATCKVTTPDTRHPVFRFGRHPAARIRGKMPRNRQAGSLTYGRSR